LKRELLSVEPSLDHGLEYRPCLVTLDDGRERDFVYVCAAEPWFDHWGVDPEDDTGKRSVPIGCVVKVRDSPSRLPARLANKMYRAGESAMGGCFFQLVLSDGRTLAVETGNAVDFLDWPSGVGPTDVIDLVPHAGRLEQGHIRNAPYAWCLFDE
jgi:hypothetical protein